MYSDDPRMRGSGLFGLWLERAELADARARAAARAAAENGTELPQHGGATAAGDARKLRGIPAIGRGVGGAIAGTDPLRRVLKDEARSADTDSS